MVIIMILLLPPETLHRCVIIQCVIYDYVCYKVIASEFLLTSRQFYDCNGVYFSLGGDVMKGRSSHPQAQSEELVGNHVLLSIELF